MKVSTLLKTIKITKRILQLLWIILVFTFGIVSLAFLYINLHNTKPIIHHIVDIKEVEIYKNDFKIGDKIKFENKLWIIDDRDLYEYTGKLELTLKEIK